MHVVHIVTERYTQPVNRRFRIVFESTDAEAGTLAGAIAAESIEYRFSPLPDGRFCIDAKADQRPTVERIVARFTPLPLED